MKITLIAGARSNFIKIAPIIHAIQMAQKEGNNIHYRLMQTGQHYDQNRSDTFSTELKIPAPDANLGCGGGKQAQLTAAIMVAFEKELLAQPVDLVVGNCDLHYGLQHSGQEIKHKSGTCGSRNSPKGFVYARRD